MKLTKTATLFPKRYINMTVHSQVLTIYAHKSIICTKLVTSAHLQLSLSKQIKLVVTNYMRKTSDLFYSLWSRSLCSPHINSACLGSFTKVPFPLVYNCLLCSLKLRVVCPDAHNKCRGIMNTQLPMMIKGFKAYYSICQFITNIR